MTPDAPIKIGVWKWPFISFKVTVFFTFLLNIQINKFHYFSPFFFFFFGWFTFCVFFLSKNLISSFFFSGVLVKIPFFILFFAEIINQNWRIHHFSPLFCWFSFWVSLFFSSWKLRSCISSFFFLGFHIKTPFFFFADFFDQNWVSSLFLVWFSFWVFS